MGAIAIYGDATQPMLYEYGGIARHLLAGEGYAHVFPILHPDYGIAPKVYAHAFPTAFTMPGYVMVMAAVLGAVGDNSTAYIILYALNVATSLAALYLLYLLTAYLLSISTARIALFIGAVAPPMVATAATFGGTPWVHMVMLAALLAVVWAVRGDAGARAPHWLWRYAAAGLLTGIWALFRGEAVGAAVLLAVWMWISERRKTKDERRETKDESLFRLSSIVYRFSRPAIYLCAVFLTILPWTIRNTVVFDRVIPMTTNFWLNAWRGNNPGTTGGSFVADESGSNWLTPEIRAEIEALPRTPTRELAIMDIYRRRTLDFVTEHPGRALVLYAKKLAMFLTIDWSDPRARNPLLLWPQLLLTLLAVAGGILLWRQRRFPWPPALVIAVTMFAVAALHMETRYQLMMGILYIVFAAAAVEAAVKRLFPERYGSHG